MASDHVLRLKRIDSEDFVLINITPIGPDLFDLRLSATEGANPFVTKCIDPQHVRFIPADFMYAVKHSRIAEYHSKKSPVSLNDWEKILEATLLQKRLEGPGRAVLGGIEVSATVIDDYVTIIFRKNVSGVKQRIGKISIQKDENHEIDTVGWVATAAARSEVLEKEIVDLKARFDEQNNVIQKLNEQLEDLIKTKKTHEESLFEKFRELLNTKKLKIRDQQRLLATSRVDPSKGLAPKRHLISLWYILLKATAD